jgi:alpha,alpha-trehalose phosphorylase
MLGSLIGYEDEAFKYFSDSIRMDIDDIQHNMFAGIHAANMAGTWEALVLGFGGVNMVEGKLVAKPTLPKAWNGYSFSLYFRGSLLRFAVSEEGTTVSLANDTPAAFLLNGRSHNLNKEGEACHESL